MSPDPTSAELDLGAQTDDDDDSESSHPAEHLSDAVDITSSAGEESRDPADLAFPGGDGDSGDLLPDGGDLLSDGDVLSAAGDGGDLLSEVFDFFGSFGGS